MEIKEDGIGSFQEKYKEIADIIRTNSADGRLTNYKDLLLAPVSLTEENAGSVINGLRSSAEYHDIVEIHGEKNIYLYSIDEMTDNYARMVFRTEENDFLNIVAETVREESRVYPRPTNIQVFTASPYNFDESVLIDILSQLKKSSSYKDIEVSRASNGAVCLYSTNYLSKDYAEALTEWLEVTQFETP